MKHLLIFFLFVSFGAAAQDIDLLYKQINRERIKHLRLPIKRSKVLEISSSDWLVRMNKKYDHMVHGKLKRDEKFELLAQCESPVVCWMKSKPHRKAILSFRVKKIGIAYLDNTYCARLQ